VTACDGMWWQACSQERSSTYSTSAWPSWPPPRAQLSTQLWSSVPLSLKSTMVSVEAALGSLLLPTCNAARLLLPSVWPLGIAAPASVSRQRLASVPTHGLLEPSILVFACSLRLSPAKKAMCAIPPALIPRGLELTAGVGAGGVAHITLILCRRSLPCAVTLCRPSVREWCAGKR
jgi:hypothetical protein